MKKQEKQIHPEIESVKARRNGLGVTQAFLAGRAGLSKSALAQLEVGQRKTPAFDTVKKLKDALDAIEKERSAGKRRRAAA